MQHDYHIERYKKNLEGVFKENNLALETLYEYLSKNSINLSTIIKRNIGATGVLTIKGVTGNINTLTNTLSATTTLATAGSYGQNSEFVWNGTNLLRIN